MGKWDILLGAWFLRNKSNIQARDNNTIYFSCLRASNRVKQVLHNKSESDLSENKEIKPWNLESCSIQSTKMFFSFKPLKKKTLKDVIASKKLLTIWQWSLNSFTMYDVTIYGGVELLALPGTYF